MTLKREEHFKDFELVLDGEDRPFTEFTYDSYGVDSIPFSYTGSLEFEGSDEDLFRRLEEDPSGHEMTLEGPEFTLHLGEVLFAKCTKKVAERNSMKFHWEAEQGSKEYK